MKRFLLAALALLCTGARAQQAPAPPPAPPIRVLTISGDWKSQPWYQDVRMGGKVLRGRYIAREVQQAAPGQFQFTDITSYTGQQYGDDAFFAQYDVVLIGDIIGWSLPPRFHQGLKNFVQRGGGFIYCGSYKWHMSLLQNTPFEEVLPARFPADGFRDDWKRADLALHEFGFQPQVGQDHPVTHGLDWATAPMLDVSGKMLPKDGAQILLKTPAGAPLLAAWQFGKGRAIFSPSIFANDEASFRYENWKDFGKYYAQLFGWLGENRLPHPALQQRAATAQVTVDATKPLNAVSSKLFSIHGAHDNPGLAPLDGKALENYRALNLDGAWARVNVGPEAEPINDNDDPHVLNEAGFNWKKLDAELEQMAHLKLEPILLFPLNYGRPEWMWDEGKSWQDASLRSADELAELVAAALSHIKNTGKQQIRYVEILNEPNVDDKNMDSFVRLVRTSAQRVHREFPGVQVGAFGNHETPYLKTFLQKIEPDLDWIASHPYGWTGEEIFRWQDEVAQFQKDNKLRALPWFITEWDFWVQGRDKFDYMMRRNFDAVQRENLIGTLHYRLGQYAEKLGLDPRREATYLFGVLWLGYGPGAGAKGTPMHDAYDAFWLFRDFRGSRVQSEIASPMQGISSHLHAAAARDGDTVNAVLYYDWGNDGGYADTAAGAQYPTVKTSLHMAFPPANKVRTLTISRAAGEGFEIVGASMEVPAGAASIQTEVTIDAVSGYSFTVK